MLLGVFIIFWLFFISCTTMNKLSSAQIDRLGLAPFYKKYSKITPDAKASIYH